MSLYTQRVSRLEGPLVPPRPLASSQVVVTTTSAMRHSAVWACLRLRGDLLSTLPVDVYRDVHGMQVEVAKPIVLVTPGGEKVEMHEWLYSSQVDLDRAGNVVGIITAVDGLGLPARIDLVDLSQWSAQIKGGEIVSFRISGKTYDPREIWHEKQFTQAGLPIGLSPVAFAAMSIGQYLSAQQFALDWFADGAIPAGELTNTAKTINKDEAGDVKDRFKAAVAGRDLFVHGNDWEFKPIQAVANTTGFIEAQQFSIVDIARFFGAPADLIDAAVSGSSVTYANITQRDLQFLITNLGPAIFRREKALSNLTQRPRRVKLNSDALLRMDPQTRAELFAKQITSRQLAPSEARALVNRLPYTDAQLAEFDRLFGAPRTNPTGATA